MLNKDNMLKGIAEALLADYDSIYYVNAITNEYTSYSAANNDSVFIENKGSDIYADLAAEAEKNICDEDKHIFTDCLNKDKLEDQIKNGRMKEITYRIMSDGKPVYHALKLIKKPNGNDSHFILGIINVDEEVKRERKAAKAETEREIYSHIATSLAEHYDTLYYVDMHTDRFFEYSSNDVYKKLNVPTSGDDFFEETEKNIMKYVHHDDAAQVIKFFKKENMIKNMNSSNTFQREYRLIMNGDIMHIRCSQMWARDKEHAIVCIEDIGDEIKAQQEYRENQRKSAIYRSIAESLASNYDMIYYVNEKSGNYIEFTSNMIYGEYVTPESGSDFFNDAIKRSDDIIYCKDQEKFKAVLSRDYLNKALDNKKQFSIIYRMLINGKPQFTRLTATWASDMENYIIGVENIDHEIRKEKEQDQAAVHENESARRDTLTGAKNLFAFHELEETLQKRIDSGSDYLPFAFVVCDIISLKIINDTLGRDKGDDYIRSAGRLICNVFKHSPVFRTYGGRFIVFLGNGDFLHKDSLISRLQEQVRLNLSREGGPVLASGLSVYTPSEDEKVSDVIERAEVLMGEDKTFLKSGKVSESKVGKPITAEHKKLLDTLFDAFSIVSEGAYIYICDMRYDFSKWSKTAVDTYGLPSEYMYGAGDIWEESIHPDDRDTYHKGISDIFSANSSSHDMQYRAKKLNGEYDVCTCRGIVLRDIDNKPVYFCGAIRNHSIQEHLDPLTGLRNQYGFFEDLQTAMSRHSPMCVYMVAINKFSEINEVYGYHSGNEILQRFGRYLFENVGNAGNVYRLDGTKFAVISKTRTPEEIREKYEKMRNYFRKGISLDNKFVILDTNAGLLNIDNFDIDYQTIYACLNYAYGESKIKRQGEMVEFFNDINSGNKQRLEKLHAIRASIMQNYKGFYLMYQPVVDAAKEKLIGAEALLRWRSEEYGIVPPDHFIPILEKDPLFCELGQWILRTAINGAKIIMEEHPDFVINVNLSYTQLEKPDFVDMVLRTLKEEGFSPDHLCLEITERCRLLDMYLLKNVITNLRGKGIQIALDDFGTGFSSISTVKNLPFDTIKIDRSFVKMIEKDEKERELIRSCVSVASTFGAKVCVEGIETPGMRDILQNYNIQSFQGYYYAMPLELRDFIQWSPDKRRFK